MEGRADCAVVEPRDDGLPRRLAMMPPGLTVVEGKDDWLVVLSKDKRDELPRRLAMMPPGFAVECTADMLVVLKEARSDELPRRLAMMPPGLAVGLVYVPVEVGFVLKAPVPVRSGAVAVISQAPE